MNCSPENLYRYRALDGDCLLYAERILLHNEIYFTSPSKLNDCILMWSHYADAHTGICLEFANDDSEPFIGRAQKVGYLPLYKRAHAIFDDSMAQVERILLSKAKCWAYQAEWRVIDHQTGHGLKYFDPLLIIRCNSRS